jgi:hypothetical protein
MRTRAQLGQVLERIPVHSVVQRVAELGDKAWLALTRSRVSPLARKVCGLGRTAARSTVAAAAGGSDTTRASLGRLLLRSLLLRPQMTWAEVMSVVAHGSQPSPCERPARTASGTARPRRPQSG